MSDRLPNMGDHVRVNSEDGRLGTVVGYGYQERADSPGVTTTSPVVIVQLLPSQAGWATIGEQDTVPPTNDPAAIFVRLLAVHLDNIFRIGQGVGSVLAEG